MTLNPCVFVIVIAQCLLKRSVSSALLLCPSIFWRNGLFSQTRHDTNYTGGKSIPTKHSAGTNNKTIKVTVLHDFLIQLKVFLFFFYF